MMDGSSSFEKNSLKEYQKIKHLGSGAFGDVCLYKKVNQKSRSPFNQFFYSHKKSDSKYYALKKYHSNFTNSQNGIDFSALRQINLLISCCHPNVANCHEIIYRRSNDTSSRAVHHDVYVAMDFYMQMTEVLNVKELVNTELDRKNICLQILQGIVYLHECYIFHRDLKPDNVFFGRDGLVKLADFGLAKQFGSPNGRYTANTCTRQYRAPELFFNTHYYTEKCDIWSFGCIVAFIFTNKTIFYTSSRVDLEVLARIFDLRGTPKESVWANYDKFPGFLRFEEATEKDIAKELKVSSEVAKIIQDCLQLCPSKRPSARQLLSHEFFKGLSSQPFEIESHFSSRIQKIQNKNGKNMDIQQELQSI